MPLSCTINNGFRYRSRYDPAGGMVGTALAVDVQSHYPQTPMSIAKQIVIQPPYGALVRCDLPADYRAQIRPPGRARQAVSKPRSHPDGAGQPRRAVSGALRDQGRRARQQLSGAGSRSPRRAAP